MKTIISILTLCAIVSVAGVHSPKQKKSEFIEVGYFNTSNPEEGESFTMHKSGERYIKSLDKEDRVTLSSVRKYVYESFKMELYNTAIQRYTSNKQNGVNRYIAFGNDSNTERLEWVEGTASNTAIDVFYEDFVKEFRQAFAKEYDN